MTHQDPDGLACSGETEARVVGSGGAWCAGGMVTGVRVFTVKTKLSQVIAD